MAALSYRWPAAPLNSAFAGLYISVHSCRRKATEGAIRELKAVGEHYPLAQVEEIRNTFRKPIVEPVDFMPSEAIK